tara:strand:+ start:207 stop:548 length:342 start_codon:yes stop_codon:yes gene_type:complete
VNAKLLAFEKKMDEITPTNSKSSWLWRFLKAPLDAFERETIKGIFEEEIKEMNPYERKAFDLFAEFFNKKYTSDIIETRGAWKKLLKGFGVQQIINKYSNHLFQKELKDLFRM